jgi:hypothetical protein
MSEISSELAGPGVLDRARRHAALSVYDLWLRYFAIGGDASPGDVESFLAHGREPGHRQYNLLVDALNERFTELGLDRPVRYAVA